MINSLRSIAFSNSGFVRTLMRQATSISSNSVILSGPFIPSRKPIGLRSSNCSSSKFSFIMKDLKAYLTESPFAIIASAIFIKHFSAISNIYSSSISSSLSCFESSFLSFYSSSSLSNSFSNSSS